LKVAALREVDSSFMNAVTVQLIGEKADNFRQLSLVMQSPPLAVFVHCSPGPMVFALNPTDLPHLWFKMVLARLTTGKADDGFTH
jgi:hypothetical protein